MELQELLDEIDTARRTGRRVWDLSAQGLAALPSIFYQDLPSLNVLHLHHNLFPSLPADIALLTDLRVLDLASNQLQQLPEEITELESLSSLFLYDNQLSFLPRNFDKLTSLCYLSIGCNQFEGEIPYQIFLLSNLVSLSCCANKISVFSTNIINLSHLTTLNLSMNSISEIPDGATLPPTLTSLNLSTNYIESLPENFLSDLTALKTLNLSYNKITEFPTDILHLTTLNALQIDNNLLSELPSGISHMTHLVTLNVDGNPLPPQLLFLHRTLKTPHFLFRLGVGAEHSLAHHVHSIAKGTKETFTRVSSASNDHVDPRRMVIENKELEELAKLTNMNLSDISGFFDVDQGTSMSKDAFRKVITKAGYSIAHDPALMDSAFSLFDLNGNGSVDRKELLLGFTVLEHGTLLQKLQFGFHLYDINHDGSIEKNELKVMLMKLGAMRGYPNSHTPYSTTTKIEEFVSQVYKDKEVLHFDDFVEAAFSNPHIADLFSLDRMFQKHAVRSSFPSPHTMRKTGTNGDSTTYRDPRKLLIKKKETKELAKLTHMKSSELLTIFDLQHNTDFGDSMSREKFREIMGNTGLIISKDPTLLDTLFDVFDLDMSGTVERKELLVGLITLHSGALTQKLKLGFHLYDANQDGSIERQELKGMLTKIAALQPNRSSTVLTTEIDDFVGRVFAGRRLLLFDDFVVAAQSDPRIAQLFVLESLFRTVS